MIRTRAILGAVSALALVCATSAPALAAGTAAGTTITNNVSVSFNVGGIAQNAVNDSDAFTVDQRVNVLVTFIGSTVSVSPGQAKAALAFDVSNLSNATIDLSLATALTAGTAANISNYAIYRDSDGNRTLSAAELAAGPITYLDEMAADQVRAVIVVADISANAIDGDTFNVTLTADASAGGGTGSLGAALNATSGANTAGIDTVLFDAAGATDSANAGDYSATGDFEVSGAKITVVKSNSIVSDPVNGTTNPKAIPGAVVQYCIAITNAANSATATSVSVADDLPADVTYLSAYGIFVDGTATVDSGTGVATCTGGSTGGAFTPGAGAGGAGQVTASLSDIAATVTRSVYFRVTIN